jgi:hypothetical protein
MRHNHKWNRARSGYYRALLFLGTLSALALALGAGSKWG